VKFSLLFFEEGTPVFNEVDKAQEGHVDEGCNKDTDHIIFFPFG